MSRPPLPSRLDYRESLPHRTVLRGVRVFFAWAVVVLTILATPTLSQAADTWTDPHPGVRRLHRTAPGPLQVHALVVDLCAPGIRVRATAPGENAQTPSSFATSVGAQVAINGDFFSYTDYNVIGMAVGNGQDWGNIDSNWQAFVAFGHHRAVFSPEQETFSAPLPWMDEVVSGFAQIVQNGQPISTYDCSGHFCQRHPRTAVGLSRDRHTLYLIVVDGRSTQSIGVTLAELAEQMHSLGAYDAVNLDGGGSSAMWVEGTGVVNSPSDGSQRIVANHLAVFASGTGQPRHCVHDPIQEARTYAPLWGGSTSTDVNGDGVTDLCARGYAGVFCRLATGLGFPEEWATSPEFGDQLGWDDPSNYSTLRFADYTGDGLADLCARGDDGVICLESTGTGFDTLLLHGPLWSDAGGWTDAAYHSTIRFADLDGDGRADLLARGPDGIDYHLSEGDGFAAASPGPAHSDASGWGLPKYYATYRIGDVDGDGRDDLCARAAAGIRCYLSTPTPLAVTIEGPEWSDAAGYNEPKYYATIRLADLDGDGRDDLCGRFADGMRCHLSQGDGFGAVISGPPLTDDTGWADPSNYLPIRMGDINGDGSHDLCARADAGIWCWTWSGSGFEEHIDGPAYSDANGWFQAKYYDTIRLADVDGDGRDDICGRGPDGVSCHLSDGSGFPDPIEGPGWADSVGWGAPRYTTTIRAQTPPATPHQSEDAGTSEIDGEIVSDDGGSPGQDASLADGSAEAQDASSDDGRGGATGGCGCALGKGGSLPTPTFFILALLLGVTFRSRWGSFGTRKKERSSR